MYETKINPGFYICESLELLNSLTISDSVFLFISPPEKFDLPAHCDAAFIQTDLSPDELLFEVCELCRSLQEWDLSLKDASLDKTNLKRMMTTAQQFFPNSISVVDRNYIIHGTPSDWSKLELFKDYTPIDSTKLKTPFSTINELLLEPEFVDSLQKEEAFLYHEGQPDACICMNILAREQFLARIISPLTYPVTPGLVYLFNHIAQYIQFIFLNYTDDVTVRRQNDKIHRLLLDLIERPDSVNRKQLSNTLVSYGWSANQNYDVTVFRFENVEELNHIYLYFCNQLEMEWLHSYAVKSENEIIWIFNNDLCSSQQGGLSRRQSLSYLIRDLVCRAGISNSFDDLTRLQHYYQQAVFAHEKGSLKRPHFWYAYFRDYTLDYIFELVKSDLAESNLYHPGVLKLISYDQTTGSSLTELLFTLISCNFNVTNAANKLFMHRSTFNRQMKKIREITRLDWQCETDPDELLHVLITLHQLSNSNNQI